MMILPSNKEALHKVWLYRTLRAISDNPFLAGRIYFKGGTCASMLGWLDRFSVDLDFDYAGANAEIAETRKELEKMFNDLGLKVYDKSKVGIQYFLKYENPNDSRNTIKIDVTFPLCKTSQYEPQRLIEIDRVFTCQTRETMFSHKLVAPMDRYEKTGHIAGRDTYDIHHFFLSGYKYDSAVISERRSGATAELYMGQLADFIEREVTDKVITEDLNSLLSQERFNKIRKILKSETIMLIRGGRKDSSV